MTQPRNFSMAGAIDLGARQAAAKRKQQAAEAPGGGSAFVFDVTDETFSAEVLARSQSVPVIMDLWAEWCGPCKQLGPILEKLAAEAAGDWLLAKVDVDANPQLSAALQVQSIPMVVAWLGGQPVTAFPGALPEPQVRQWIKEVLRLADEMGMPARVRGEAQAGHAGGADQAEGAGAPRGAQRGPGMRGPAEQPGPAEMLGDARFETAQKAMDAGDMDGAAAALEQVLADTPDHPVAKAWLAQVDLIRRVTSYDRAAVRRAAQDKPDDAQAQIRAADVELAGGQVTEAFDRLLGAFGRAAGADKNAIRVHLLGLFEVLPPRDARVTRARARLSSMLF